VVAVFYEGIKLLRESIARKELIRRRQELGYVFFILFYILFCLTKATKSFKSSRKIEEKVFLKNNGASTPPL
jgi:hypothetical protein